MCIRPFPKAGRNINDLIHILSFILKTKQGKCQGKVHQTIKLVRMKQMRNSSNNLIIYDWNPLTENVSTSFNPQTEARRDEAFILLNNEC